MVNLVELVFLEFLGQREILVELVLKVVQVFKVQEGKLANLVCLERQGKWVHQERMGAMEKKEDLEFLVLLDLQDSQDLEVNLA